MNTNLLEKLDTETEQRLTLRGISWQDYLTIDSVLEDVPGLRLTYCQGLLEVMTLSPRPILRTVLEQESSRSRAKKSLKFQPKIKKKGTFYAYTGERDKIGA